jgi:hypothetical protein
LAEQVLTPIRNGIPVPVLILNAPTFCLLKNFFDYGIICGQACKKNNFLQKAFAVVATGETALYGNILIQKGVI